MDASINFLNSLNLDIRKKQKSNLSKEQWNAINQLKNNDGIIIKEADKGGSIVIMTKRHYKKMVYEQLNDNITYRRTNDSCDNKVMKELGKLVEKYKDNLMDKEIDYLINFSHNTSNFYGLPKVHKSDIITQAIMEQNNEYIKILEPEDLTLRPIVAGPNCPTKRLSKFIDIIIKPLVIHVKSYIRDSIDFLQKCSRSANEKTILCRFDVKSLYTNIPHEYGLRAISFWLDRHQATISSRFPKAFIMESVQFILKNNNFKFNDELFLQLIGTAMGTDMAPTYATFTMGYNELEFYEICQINWGRAFRKYIEENWGRFLDDCEILVEEDKIHPNALLEVLNSISLNIQFTMTCSKKMVPFLDVLIRKEQSIIWTDLYIKPADTRRYLPF